MKISNSFEPQILVIDDESVWQRNIKLLLRRQLALTKVFACEQPLEAEKILNEHRIDLVVLDVTMPGLGGIELLRRIRQSYPDLPVIMLTGRDQVEIAVDCMKAGAFDFFIKTCEQERFAAGVERALKQVSLIRENSFLVESLQKMNTVPDAFSDLISCSPQMFSIYRYLQSIAPGNEAILITGESGVGKELVVQAFHRLSRFDKPLVSVNVAGLDEQSFSDTLFGHIRGAFTGAERARRGMIEKAGDGILFLDEIGDLDLSLQIKLLRLLQEREYYPLGSDNPSMMRARIILATNQNLKSRVEEGHFREDLYYRLRSHLVEIPPLRERKEDFPLLVEHFLKQAAVELGKNIPEIPAELYPILACYSFPGNVRELRSLVYEALGRHVSGSLPLYPFRNLLEPREGAAQDGRGYLFAESLPTLKQAADDLVDEALRRADGNQATAARLLGISRPALSQRLKKKSIHNA